MPTVVIPIEANGDDTRANSTLPTVYADVVANSHFDGFDVNVQRSFRSWSGNTYAIDVAFMRFNTDTYLPDNATITAAKLTGYCYAQASTDSLNFVIEYYSWPTLSTSNWTRAPGNNAHSGTPLSTIAINADNDFTLQNVTNISRTAKTDFRIAVSQLASDAAPTGDNWALFRDIEHATDPPWRLSVTYVIEPTEADRTGKKKRTQTFAI